MKYRSEFKHGFTNPGYLHCAILNPLHGFKEKRALKERDMQFFLQNIQMRFSRFSKCLKTTWNSPEQPAGLTQILSTQTKTPHSKYSYFATIIDHCCDVIIESL